MYNEKNIPSCCQDKCDANKDINTAEFSKINEIHNYFKMPISYNKKKVELNKSIISDLELISPIDTSSNPIYSFCFNNRDENTLSKQVMKQSANYYTTDVSFLKDTQQLLKEYKPFSKKNINTEANNKTESKYKNILDIWNELKIENGFKEKYCYIDWDILDFLNKSVLFLQFMSIYNLLSPIFSFFVPILILLIPFFIIKAKVSGPFINDGHIRQQFGII
jgi:hypothetical protein